MIDYDELRRRIEEASSDADYRAIVEWLVTQGCSQHFASQVVTQAIKNQDDGAG